MNTYKTPSFEERRKNALALAEERCAQVRAKSKDFERVEKELSEIGLKIFSSSLLPDGKREEEQARLEDLCRRLKDEKNKILKSLGYPEDYTSPHFTCEKCGDTGYIGYKMCSCLKAWRSGVRARVSGLGKNLDTQTFDTFSLDYYPAKNRAYMSDVLDFCRDFADGFERDSGQSLLFVGGTGLGKTHLSSAVAKTVIDRGFSVIYDSAQNILATFERERFSQNESLASDKYFDCDLLIIDDLGTEIRGASSLSYFYTLINTRIVSSKSVIISTNLTPDALRRQYEERLVSRLFGEYNVFLFEGEDIRKLKK